MDEWERKQYMLGYSSGMRDGKDRGNLLGASEMLSRVIETIQEMEDDTYAEFNKDTLAHHLYKELKDAE